MQTQSAKGTGEGQAFDVHLCEYNKYILACGCPLDTDMEDNGQPHLRASRPPRGAEFPPFAHPRPICQPLKASSVPSHALCPTRAIHHRRRFSFLVARTANLESIASPSLRPPRNTPNAVLVLLFPLN